MDISTIRDTRTGKFAKLPKVCVCVCVSVCVCVHRVTRLLPHTSGAMMCLSPKAVCVM